MNKCVIFAKPFRALFTALFVTALLPSLFSCGEKGDVIMIEKTSLPPSEIVSAYSPYVLNSGEPVVITFQSAVGPADSLVARVENSGSLSFERVIKITPELKGEEVWSDDGKRISFIPDRKSLKYGRDYMFELGITAPALGFHIKYQPPRSYLTLDGPVVSSSDPKKVSLSGFITMNVSLPDEVRIEDFISCSGCDGTPEVSVEREGNTKYRLVIENIERRDSDYDLEIIFKASGLGLGEDCKVERTVPGDDHFKILDLIPHFGKDPYMEIRFSALLDEDQQLQGLIYIDESSDVKIKRDGSVVKLYFSSSKEDMLTVHVKKAVRDRDRNTLEEEWIREVDVPEHKPAVEILAKGNILPDDASLILPFKAVNLAAVDVNIIKIYSDNVFSFIQDNGMNGSWGLRKVAKSIYRRTIRLDRDKNLNLNDWQNFSIDLSGLFEKERNAIYRVELSFRKEYHLYKRSQPDLFTEIFSTEPEESYTLTEYNWSDYRWDESDDPTKASYYMNDSRFPGINLTATNLGIVVKRADESVMWVAVNDIMTTDPLPGVSLVLYDYQAQVIGKATTTADGMAELPFKGTPYIIKASSGDVSTYMVVAYGEENSLSRFDVGGKEISGGMKGYVYGERGVWRPGDTVHLTLIVENISCELPDNHPVTMQVTDPRESFFDKQISQKGTDGFYTFKIAIPDNAPTGRWNAAFKVGGATFNKSFAIETIKPNRLKINLSLGEKTILEAGKRETLSIGANWLTGPVAAGLNSSVKMILSPLKNPFPLYKGYTFSNPLSSFVSKEVELLSSPLDSSGKCSKSVMIGKCDGAGGILGADIVSSVEEPGGGNSVTSMKIKYSPFGSYVGVNLGDGRYETDKDLSIPVKVVDKEGGLMKNRTVKYSIYKLRWSWWWEGSASMLRNYANGEESEKVVSESVVLKDGEGEIAFRVDYPEWGRYLLLAEDTESGHIGGGTFIVDWPHWRGRSDKSDPDALTILPLTSDKKECQVGEQVTLFVPASDGGRALVSIENAAKVISSHWVGTDSRSDTKYTFTVTEEMAPNFYIHVTLLQPHSLTADMQPLRMYGVLPITVMNPDSHLEPVISLPQTVEPQRPFDIKVSEKSGRRMTYTVAIVDEGLLDITSFKTPDPWSAMNERQALGVETWDLYDDVIGAFNGRFQGVLSVGGDESVISGRPQNQRRFNPVVKFLGPFTLEKGRNVHTITLPQYIGSVRVMVVAGGDGRYGNAHRNVTVKSPLMVLSTLPRVAANGDKISLPVNLFVSDEKIRSVDVEIETEGPVSIEGANARNLLFAEAGDTMVEFALRCDSSERGVAKVKVKAVGTGYRAEEVVVLNVENHSPLFLRSDDYRIDPLERKSISWEPFDPSEDEGVSLTLSAFPAISYSGLFDYLCDYRHLCSEQLSSIALSILYAGDLLEKEDRKSAEERVNDIISLLASRQLSDGGFSYWPGFTMADPWVTSMAGHVLCEADRRGYKIPFGVLPRWRKYQQRMVKNYVDMENPLYGEDLQQAYRLYTLVLSGNSEYGAMNRMRESGRVTDKALYRLAAAYCLDGKVESAEKIVADIVNRRGEAAGREREYRYYPTFGSALRDRAMIMETLVLMGREGEAMEYAGKIASEFKVERSSTQEIAFVSVAMGRLADAVGVNAGEIEVKRGNRESETIGELRGVATCRMDPESAAVEVRNKNQSTIFAVLTTVRRPEMWKKVAAKSDGVEIKVDYLLPDGKKADIANLPQGTEFEARIRVTAKKEIYEQASMALTFTAPSGWEIWNERLLGSVDEYEENVSYVDYRDGSVRFYFTISESNMEAIFRVRLQASYKGEYHLAPIYCEDMYNPSYCGNTESFSVRVK